MDSQQEENPWILWLRPAKKMYACSHRQAKTLENCVDPFPQFYQSLILSFVPFFWPIIKRGFLPVHKPILHRHLARRQNPCRSQTPNQASFHKNLKCRYFMNHCSWRPFLLEGRVGSSALWFSTKNSSRNPLCPPPPHNSSVPHRLGVEGTAWKNNFPLNSVARTGKWKSPYNEIAL